MSKSRKKPCPRDEKGRFVSPISGAPVPDSPASHATRFKKGDPRASEAAKKSHESRRRDADLRQLCRIWMSEEVGKDKDGRPITGGEMMVKVAVKEIAKGNPRFWELIRDTAGFKPVDRVMVAEVEPAVIAEVEEMVREAAADDKV